ncbi:MAG: ferritin [Clostridiaceae bacterium]|jgi:ferritin|nr:ferritin [Clostridiaceae bacterium]
MNKKLSETFSAQINKEYFSAFLYLGMSNWFNQKGLRGMANWTYVQYQEELAHAQNLHHYMQYRNESVTLSQIDDPSGSWQSPLEVFRHVLKHEQYVTESINNLATVALKANDHAAYNFMQWYVSEQVEEEANANDIIDRLVLSGDNSNALLMIDDQLGARTFAAPVVPGLPAGA